MGQDKALLMVGGAPMARRVADAARAAGASCVVALGGDAPALEAIGLATRADTHPGEGPLPAVAAALAACREDLLLVLACDLVAPSPAAMAATIDALDAAPDADVAVPVDGDGRRQWVHAAWRTRAVAGLRASISSGVRSMVGGAASLEVVEVAGLDPAALRDADHPGELPEGG
jgi:molybdopterin-guanine dinucleotide biosynthesis protein A